MRHLATAVLALAACATTEDTSITQRFDDGSVAKVRETESGVEATLRAPDVGVCATLSWTAGDQHVVVRMGGHESSYRIAPVDITAETASDMVHGAWLNRSAKGSTQGWCGLIDLYIAESSCGRLVDAGDQTQCVRDVLNDIC